MHEWIYTQSNIHIWTHEIYPDTCPCPDLHSLDGLIPKSLRQNLTMLCCRKPSGVPRLPGTGALVQSTFDEFIYGYWRRYYVVVIFQPRANTLSQQPSSILWHIWCVYQPPSIHPVSLYRHPSPLPAILSTLSTDLYCDYFLIHL